ncbi:hypothetical protein [Candidatus Magnetominusculus dajiuhuensis]|uniref:hypothetical protein n=1 Tax=Candidatus Magnetominusculus dajiuhuensis TaxID=3137712 RepID=UPI003B430CA1
MYKRTWQSTRWNHRNNAFRSSGHGFRQRKIVQNGTSQFVDVHPACAEKLI